MSIFEEILGGMFDEIPREIPERIIEELLGKFVEGFSDVFLQKSL